MVQNLPYKMLKLKMILKTRLSMLKRKSKLNSWLSRGSSIVLVHSNMQLRNFKRLFTRSSTKRG